MQHSFKSMMNMKNSEIGALSQELRKLNYALEQEAKENMENKRKIRALTLELETLKGNGGNMSPLSSCSHLIEDDVSSLHSVGSTTGGGGGGPPGPPGSSPRFSPSMSGDRNQQNVEFPLSGNGSRPYDNQHSKLNPQVNVQGQGSRQQGFFSGRSPPLQGGQSPNSQHHQFQGSHLPPPQQNMPFERDNGSSNGMGGDSGSIFYPQSNSQSGGHFFPPGQHAPRQDQGWNNSMYGNDMNFSNINGGGNASGVHDSGKTRNWDGLDYSDRDAASLMSMLDERDDKTAGTISEAPLSKLSLSDGPPGFDLGCESPPGFQGIADSMPPGFAKVTSNPSETEGNDNDSNMTGGSEGVESTDIINSIRLQSKSSKLDASPVSLR